MKELSKLLGFSNHTKYNETLEYQLISMSLIDFNPFQPRKEIDEDKMKELMQSIKTYGLIQPILVRKRGERFQLVAGERRLRAMRRLNHSKIPAVVKNLADSALAAVALIENLQRENLSFIEEAEGFEKLIHEFGLTQEVLAQRLGKSQAAIANKLRLLRLPESIKQRINISNITERHARALLKLPGENSQLAVLNQLEEEGLTVQQTEELIETILSYNRKGKLENDNAQEKASSEKGETSSDQASLCNFRKSHASFVKDTRIFVNTVYYSIELMKEAGMEPEVEEREFDDRYEILISLPKGEQLKGKE